MGVGQHKLLTLQGVELTRTLLSPATADYEPTTRELTTKLVCESEPKWLSFELEAAFCVKT